MDSCNYAPREKGMNFIPEGAKKANLFDRKKCMESMKSGLISVNLN